jgi:hypothetical protein
VTRHTKSTTKSGSLHGIVAELRAHPARPVEFESFARKQERYAEWAERIRASRLAEPEGARRSSMRSRFIPRSVLCVNQARIGSVTPLNRKARSVLGRVSATTRTALDLRDASLEHRSVSRTLKG